MHYILFFSYLLFFCFLLPRIKFIKKSGLSSTLIISLFLTKVLAGIAYGWINTHYLKGDDTFTFFNNSIKETDLLLSNPSQYFKDFFTSRYNNYDGFFETSNSFWNDLRGTLVEKLLSIFNIFSFKNYYIDVLFFNFLIFFGCIALYRTFIKVYPKSSWIIIAGIFIPSTLYYTSGMHKDGLILLGIAIIIFNMYLIIELKSKKVIHYILSLAGLILIFLIRNFFCMAIIPACICWFIAARYPKRSLLVFVFGYIIVVVVFFTGCFIHPSFNFPQKVSDRQHAFLSMNWARSYIPTDSLQPNIVSFVKKTPEAFNHVLLRPYLSENYTPFYTAAGIETVLLMLSILLFIMLRKPFIKPFNSFILFCLFFSFTCLLIIGYTIPIIGAIVRYRSVFLPLLFIPVWSSINWGKYLNNKF